MSELVVWLTAILDEDERVARAAAGTPWEKSAWEWHAEGSEVRRGYGNTLVVKFSWPDQIAHIALHDPASVLADIAAKRAILDQHRLYLGGGAREQLCQMCGGEGVMNVVSWPCNTIRLLASAYAHRDGFDPAWAVLDEVDLW